MSVIFFLIPLSIVFAACFLVAFIWAVRSGQYEDNTTPSLRVLLDEAGQEKPVPMGLNSTPEISAARETQRHALSPSSMSFSKFEH